MSTFSTRPSSSIAVNRAAPPRLGDGGGTEFERQLVASASRDGVPAASMAKVAAGLREAVAAQGAGAAASASLPGARAAGTFGVLTNLRPWLVGAVGAAVVGAGVVAATWRAAPAETVAPRVELPEALSATPHADVTPPSLGIESPSAAVAAAPPMVGPSSRPPERPRSAAPRPAAKAPGDRARASVASPAAPADSASGLAAEVRAIESVQTQLGWGQVQQAAAALADYRRRYPKGELALEADLLDIDVALARGDRARAKQLARALLARPAASRYRARLQAVDDANTRPRPRAAGSIDNPGYMKERR